MKYHFSSVIQRKILIKNFGTFDVINEKTEVNYGSQTKLYLSKE
jgi:hypothetical protein